MLTRVRMVLAQLIRNAAALPLRSLAESQQAEIVETITASMVREMLADGVLLRFATSTPLLRRRAESLLSKEPDTINWIERFGSGEVFWDIGANIGTFSIFAAALRDATVVAFEPSADNYAALCRNIELNALGNKVTPYCLALAGNTRLGVLNSESRRVGASLHQFGALGETSRYWQSAESIAVQGMIGFGVDDFIAQFSPPFPAHLKVDVDGSELEILRSAAATLRDPRLRSVMAELSLDDDGDRTGVTALMGAAGFRLVGQGEPQSSAGATAANHFFVRADA